MRLNGHWLFRALAICGASSTLALAALPPSFDFTGHWSGAATGQGASSPLTVDFAPTSNPRKFTGSTILGDPLGTHYTCTLTAKYRKTLKLHLKCDNGKKSTLPVRFDTTTQTVAGSFLVGRRHPRRAMFTLTRTSG